MKLKMSQLTLQLPETLHQQLTHYRFQKILEAVLWFVGGYGGVGEDGDRLSFRKYVSSITLLSDYTSVPFRRRSPKISLDLISNPEKNTQLSIPQTPLIRGLQSVLDRRKKHDIREILWVISNRLDP